MSKSCLPIFQTLLPRDTALLLSFPLGVSKAQLRLISIDWYGGDGGSFSLDFYVLSSINTRNEVTPKCMIIHNICIYNLRFQEYVLWTLGFHGRNKENTNEVSHKLNELRKNDSC